MTRVDAIVSGYGMAGVAVALTLARIGDSVVLIPGAARSRGTSTDAIVAHQGDIETLFGDSPQGYVLPDGRSTWLRADLEQWTHGLATEAGVDVRHDLVNESLALRNDVVILEHEGLESALETGAFYATEGSDPRFLLKCGLRPDYEPTEQIAFARTIVRAVKSPPDLVYDEVVETLPVHISQVPVSSTESVVSAAVLVENLMRANMSAEFVLKNHLHKQSIPVGETGPELISMRRATENIRWTCGPVVLSLDMAGVIDPRNTNRWTRTIQAGKVLSAWIESGKDESWDSVAAANLAVWPIKELLLKENERGFIEEYTPTRGQNMRRLGEEPLRAAWRALRGKRR